MCLESTRSTIVDLQGRSAEASKGKNAETCYECLGPTESQTERKIAPLPAGDITCKVGASRGRRGVVAGAITTKIHAGTASRWLSHASMVAFGLFLCRVEYDAYVAVERKVPLGCCHNLVESHRIQAVFIRVHQIKGIVKLDYGPDLA